MTPTRPDRPARNPKRYAEMYVAGLIDLGRGRVLFGNSADHHKPATGARRTLTMAVASYHDWSPSTRTDSQ